MICLSNIQQIKKIPIEERIKIIELLLRSIKSEIKTEPYFRKPQFKPFKVPQFNLGKEIHIDRDELYAERA